MSGLKAPVNYYCCGYNKNVKKTGFTPPTHQRFSHNAFCRKFKKQNPASWKAKRLLALSFEASFAPFHSFLFQSPFIHCLKSIQHITDRIIPVFLHRSVQSFIIFCIYLFFYISIYSFLAQTESLRALAREQLQMWVMNIGYNRVEGQHRLKAAEKAGVSE